MHDDQPSKSDMRLIGRAIRQRWPIEDESRQAIIERLLRIVADPTSKPRDVTAASRVLLAAEAQNQKDEPIPEQRRDSIAALLDRVRNIDGPAVISRDGEDDDIIETEVAGDNVDGDDQDEAVEPSS